MAREVARAHDRPMEPTIHSAERPQPLRRATGGRMIGGVCGGLADYFDVDVVLVRIAVAFLALVGGAGVPLYLAAWFLVPDEDTDESIAERLLGDLRGHGWTPQVRHGQEGRPGDAQAS
jgi:phage shock protein PspC (stress-responsive transcriptional regulator)